MGSQVAALNQSDLYSTNPWLDVAGDNMKSFVWNLCDNLKGNFARHAIFLLCLFFGKSNMEERKVVSILACICRYVMKTRPFSIN